MNHFSPLFSWSYCHEDRRSVDWDSSSPGSFGLGGTKRVVRFVPPESFLGDSECVNGPTFRLASICSARILEQPS